MCWRIRFTTTVFSSPYAHSNLARKTSAIPPAASFRTSSYLPIFAKGSGRARRILPQDRRHSPDWPPAQYLMMYSTFTLSGRVS
jgi:hypothetical protein